tara:strand:- start:1217 stop:1708 length:492 start_codon:yes stop_codon:yes gene_type:complete
VSPSNAPKSKAQACLGPALGCGALILLSLALGGGFLYFKAQASRDQSRADALAVLEQVLAKDYQVPKGEVIRLVTRGSYADNYEAETKELLALRTKVGAAPDQVVLVEQKEWLHSPEAARPSGFDLVVDLVRGGESERWSFRYHYNNLPLARLVVLRTGQRHP